VRLRPNRGFPAALSATFGSRPANPDTGWKPMLRYSCERSVGVYSKPRSVQASCWDEGYFSHDSRHFVPGYDPAVPPGRNTFSEPRL
jgi:hypothetical protein